MEKVDVLIIGAGVVGLAVAAELAGRPAHENASIVLLERHDALGQETSSRNSEVIHAGIYYPTGSLKASLCVDGKELLYRFCGEWSIPHRKTGKLIVAREKEEMALLENLIEQGRANGVMDLELLDEKETARLEPHIRAAGAILSPSTGVIDSHRLMKRLEELALQRGVLLGYRHEVRAISYENGIFQVSFCNPDGSEERMQSQWLINSAGLQSGRIAEMAGLNTEETGYLIYPCKGEYFSLPYQKSSLVSRPVYPPPLDELQGLGVHLTKTLDGRLRLGPNAYYVQELDYAVKPEHAEEFYEMGRTFLPFLERDDLEPEMAGIRPKLQGPGMSFRDFVISHERARGFPGLINLIGIESPGLTCCLSIGRQVAGMMEEGQ